METLQSKSHLSVETMIAAACADIDLKDFRDFDPREGLARYLQDINDLPLNETVRTDIAALMHRWLVNGLRFADDLKKHWPRTAVGVNRV